MSRTRIVASLRDLARQVGAIADGSEWHLFGSVDRDDLNASDIDLIILCIDASQADALRHAIDPDSLPLPLHLSLLTYAEAMEVDAVRIQHASRIYP
jgi:predicted nucleotidyltransferase